MSQEFRDQSHKSESQPKSLAERLQWMADNLPGFLEELDVVDQAQRRAMQVCPVASPISLEPEHQVKTITLSYSDFCLLIGLVAARAGSDQDSTGECRRLYVRLGGSL